MTSDLTFPNYGLHKIKGVTYLFQGRGPANFIGLKAISDMRVDNPYGVRFCNHVIPTAAPLPDQVHWKMFQKLMKDPLVQVMLPLPRAENDRFFYLEDPDDELGLYLVLLSKLSSPISKVAQPVWTFSDDKLQKAVSITNIQPLILTQVTTKAQRFVNQVGKLSRYEPRTVIATGDGDVIASKPCKRIKTRIKDFPLEDLAQLAMEGLGAAIIRRYCRNENLEADMEDRQTRRARLIEERRTNW